MHHSKEIPGPPPLPLPRAEGFLRRVPVIAEWAALGAEARANPYAFFHFGRRDARGRRRALWMGIAALACATVSFQAAAGAQTISSAQVVGWWCVARLLLIWIAAARAASVARRELAPERIEQLYLSGMTGRDLAYGWALTGWGYSLPETLLAFYCFYPWFESLGLLGTILPWLELIQVAILQFLAAQEAANLRLRFRQRHEALAAGWIAGVFAYPTLFLGRILTLGFLASLIPQSPARTGRREISGDTPPPPKSPRRALAVGLAVVFLAALAVVNAPLDRITADWFEPLALRFQRADVLFGAMQGAMLLFLWIAFPLAAAREPRRLLELADAHAPEMRPYLEQPPKAPRGN